VRGRHVHGWRRAPAVALTKHPTGLGR
jgi:hypothetical protein